MVIELVAMSATKNLSDKLIIQKFILKIKIEKLVLSIQVKFCLMAKLLGSYLNWSYRE